MRLLKIVRGAWSPPIFSLIWKAPSGVWLLSSSLPSPNFEVEIGKLGDGGSVDEQGEFWAGTETSILVAGRCILR